ncbi:hypothetical protein [Pararhizobium sp. A13]|uniref:hypothetical protein n=1 Tax=Pararhizobium sp. A13 TaxID=3133975 RepID=UPI00311AD2FD
MLTPKSTRNGRGDPAATLAAMLPLFLLAASIHWHLLCDIVCFHGETEPMMADICHGIGSRQP